MVLEQANNILHFTPNIESMRKAGIAVIENKEQLLQAISEAEEDIKAGREYPVDDVIKGMEKKFRIKN